MKRLRIAFVLLAALPFVVAAQARSYDCAASPSDYAPEGIWEISGDIIPQVMADWSQFVADRHELFLPRFCGVIEKGQQMIMFGAVRITGDDALCDDPANFAVFYDPRTRHFGTAITGQTFCARGRVLHRPTP